MKSRTVSHDDVTKSVLAHFIDLIKPTCIDIKIDITGLTGSVNPHRRVSSHRKAGYYTVRDEKLFQAYYMKDFRENVMLNIVMVTIYNTILDLVNCTKLAEANSNRFQFDSMSSLQVTKGLNSNVFQFFSRYNIMTLGMFSDEHKF